MKGYDRVRGEGEGGYGRVREEGGRVGQSEGKEREGKIG